VRRIEEREFAEFAEAHRPWLVRTASALAGDPHAGQDLAQDALVKAYVHWRRVSRADQPRAYLRQVLVRCAIDASRRPSRREVVRDRDDLPAPSARVEDHAQALVDRDHVSAVLDGLPPRQRQVLVLRFVEDLDVATTARLLRVREGTVKSTTSAALAALRTALAPAVSTEVTR
jgi:RNA polymerase sigma-70 factor (sigma-E family)